MKILGMAVNKGAHTNNAEAYCRLQAVRFVSIGIINYAQ